MAVRLSLMAAHPFRILLSDIGGVLGTNGWDGLTRRRTCEAFGIAHESIEARHKLVFDSYERGFVSLEEYLNRVFFVEPRSFSFAQLRDYIYDASVPWFENLEFFKVFRRRNNLQMGLVSNEGQGITGHRIRKFKLRELADFMVVSHFTHMRKPDPEIWQLALDLAGGAPEETIYVDDRAVFAEIASDLGLTGLHYRNLDGLKQQLAGLGLQID